MGAQVCCFRRHGTLKRSLFARSIISVPMGKHFADVTVRQLTGNLASPVFPLEFYAQQVDSHCKFSAVFSLCCGPMADDEDDTDPGLAGLSPEFQAMVGGLAGHTAMFAKVLQKTGRAR